MPNLELGRLRKVKVKDFAIRFAFGGAISVIAAVLGHLVTTRFGGVFTAFPAILVASLTLINQKDGTEPSAENAEGGVAGALALALTALVLALTLAALTGALSLLLALAVWLVLAVAFYALGVMIGWLRTTRPTPRE